MRHFLLIITTIISSVLLTNCSESEDDLIPNEVILISGDEQVADSNEELALPLVARVVNKSGIGIEGIEVSWSKEKGDGTILTSDFVTDEKGEVSATFAVGDYNLMNRIRIKVTNKTQVYSVFREFKSPVYGTLTDPSTGRTYQTVVINDQTWMAENLVMEEGLPGSVYYDDIDEMLYQWDAAMVTPDSITFLHRGICPEGWHLPTVDDMIKLADIVDNNASYLKASPQGNNLSGFNGILHPVNYDWIYYEGPDGIPSRWLTLWTSSDKFAFNEEWRDILGINMLEPSKIYIGPTAVNGLTIYYSFDAEYYNCVRCLKN